MNEDILFSALSTVQEEYILDAGEKLGLGNDKKYGFRLRRFTVVFAAVLAVLLLMLTSAMALNNDFRALIIDFFHIPMSEVVDIPIETQITQENMYMEPRVISIGDKLQGRYFHSPVATHARGGVFLVCSDDVEMKQGSRYDAYYESDGIMYKLDNRHFSQDYTVFGENTHLEFDWVAYRNNVVLTFVEPDAPFRKLGFSGAADSCLVQLDCTLPDGSSSAYPVLLNLNTGEMTDLLAAIDDQNCKRVLIAAIDEEKTGMLLYCADGIIRYVDLVSSTPINLDAVSGSHVSGCTLLEGAVACWNQENGFFTCWLIDLNSLERRELFSMLPDAYWNDHQTTGVRFLSGFDSMFHDAQMHLGTQFALLLDESDNCFVIDLLSGEHMLIPGLNAERLEQCRYHLIPSTDGKKLFMSGGFNEEGNARYMAILDFETKSFLEFERENDSQARGSICWFDNETIAIPMSENEWTREFYLYTLQ